MSLALSITGWVNFGSLTRAVAHALRWAYIGQLKKRHEWKAAFELRSLNDYELKDIGVSRSEIDARVCMTDRS